MDSTPSSEQPCHWFTWLAIPCPLIDATVIPQKQNKNETKGNFMPSNYQQQVKKYY